MRIQAHKFVIRVLRCCVAMIRDVHGLGGYWFIPLCR